MATYQASEVERPLRVSIDMIKSTWFVSNETRFRVTAVGSLAIGPFAVAFVVGVLAGFALYELDDHFGLTDKLGRLYDEGLDKLGRFGRRSERTRKRASTNSRKAIW